MYCQKCGKIIADNSTVCPNCGIAIATAQQQQLPQQMPVINVVNTANANATAIANGDRVSPCSKMVTLILCLLGFIGIAGIHRLYVGKWLTGILWLVSLGLCGIGTIIDIIVIFQGQFTDGAGRVIER